MWGLGTGIAGTSILAAGCNPITAALGALNIGLYAGVYTPMKVCPACNDINVELRLLNFKGSLGLPEE